MVAGYPLLLVEWLDACHDSQHYDDESVKRRDAGVLSSTVGWLVNESRTTLTLAATINESGVLVDLTDIPRGIVRRQRRLKTRK